MCFSNYVSDDMTSLLCYRIFITIVVCLIYVWYNSAKDDNSLHTTYTSLACELHAISTQF